MRSQIAEAAKPAKPVYIEDHRSLFACLGGRGADSSSGSNIKGLGCFSRLKIMYALRRTIVDNSKTCRV